jgi:acetylornithine deacetylase/succinyl-diaminopimelate desuccinylase-like protein
MTREEYIENHKDKFLDELFDLLRMPSISADSAFAGDVQKAAEYVAKRLQEAGADNVVLEKTVTMMCNLQFQMSYGILLLLSQP